MFWGTQLKQGQTHKLTATDGLVVHLSNVALADAENKVQVYAKVNGKEFILANLEKGKVSTPPHPRLNKPSSTCTSESTSRSSSAPRARAPCTFQATSSPKKRTMASWF